MERRSGGPGAGSARAAPAPGAPRGPHWLLRLGGLALVDGIAIWLVYQMLRDGFWPLGTVLAGVTLLVNRIFLQEELYPLRWISPGLALLAVMVLYPILFTVYTAFTNYGDGHLLSKPLAIRVLEQRRYLPEGQALYDYVAYVSPQGDYLLWLVAPDGSQLLVRPEAPPEPVEGEPPEVLEGYRRLSRGELIREGHTARLVQVTFGVGEHQFRVSDKRLGKAGRYIQRYTYLPQEDAILDNATGKRYRAVEGSWVAEDGEVLQPGFQVFIGAENFRRLLTNPALRQPFIRVFLWTVAFAGLTVVTTFGVGLFLALLFNPPEMPFRRAIRSMLLIPYAIPAFISVPIWVGLLNPQYGVVNLFLRDTLGLEIPWFSHPYWAKVGVVLVNLWLGFPYMFLISTGALQALPGDIYEAAEIDGAGPWQRFRFITFPLLLISLGPLLVASFAFNFNNFVVIDLYNQGGPPMSGTPSPVGHTDILVTYTYRIAFASGRGADLGYAAAITVAIFLILVAITYIQFRYTRMLEERAEQL